MTDAGHNSPEFCEDVGLQVRALVGGRPFLLWVFPEGDSGVPAFIGAADSPDVMLEMLSFLGVKLPPQFAADQVTEH